MTKASAPELPPLQHQTLALADYHYLNGQGIPDMHQTRQRIRALAPITHIPYRFDTDELSVEGVEGCRAGQVYEAAPGLYAVDLTLEEPLKPGDEATLDYITHFRYNERPDPVFRRAIGARAIDLDIDVVFDNRYPPTSVWQSTWDSYQPGSLVAAESSVTPELYATDAENSLGVTLSQEGLQNTVIGFRWEWPEQLM